MKKTIIVITTVMLIISVWIYWSWNHANDYKFNEGKKAIIKIEQYFLKTGKYPDSLKELGIKESLEGPIFYRKQNDKEYIIWFGTTLGNSMIYNSKTKKWEEKG